MKTLQQSALSAFKQIFMASAALIMSLGALLTLQVPTAQAAFPGPNGRIAYTDLNSNIFTINPDGTEKRQLTTSENNGSPTWTANSQQIIYVSNGDAFGYTEIYKMNADGSNKVKLTNFNEYNGPTGPTVSPDGTKILFTRSPGFIGYQVYVMNSDGTNVIQLTNGNNQEAYANGVWSPDGSSVAYMRSAGYPVSFTQIIKRSYTNGTFGPEQVLASHDGFGIFGRGPDWSPDSSKLVYAKAETGGVYTIDANGAQPPQLIATVLSAENFKWSPDGSKLLYNRNIFVPAPGGGNYYEGDLFTMNADGSGTHTNVTGESPITEQSPSWGSAPLLTPSDTTAPTVTVTSPGSSVTLGSSVTANYSCQDETGGSGLQSCVGSVANGALLDTSSVGAKSFTITATDTANNTFTKTVSYAVTFQFSGFLGSIDGNLVNKAKAGSAVPVQYRLVDASGTPISTASSFVSLTSSQYTCNAGDPTDPVLVDTSGGSGLQYLGDGYWQYNWKTAKTFAGTCRMLNLNMADGTRNTAKFQF